MYLCPAPSLSLSCFQANNLEEAAQCKLHIASLIAEYLKVKNSRSLPFERSALLCVCPNVMREPSLFENFAVVCTSRRPTYGYIRDLHCYP